MTLPVEANPLLLGSSGVPSYDLTKSVRLRAAATASFTRTVGTPTTQNVWTYNAWIKLGNLTANMHLLNTGTSGSTTYERLVIQSTGVLSYLASSSTGTNQLSKVSTVVFRDPSAWYNVHVIKTAAANSSVNAIRVFINNLEITTWTTNAYVGTQASVPDSINVASSVLALGTSNSVAFDGYLANINFVDGLALKPESFITVNTGNGMAIKPKVYIGAFGANGFWLTFTDNSDITATTIGKDTSGNNNNFTPSGISITAGTTYDSMLDVPTLTNSTIANFPTLSQLTLGTSCVLTEANLTATWTSITAATGVNTQSNFPIPRTGKYYFEVLLNTSSNGCADFGIWPINNLPTKGAVGTLATSYSLRPGGAGTGTMRKFNNGNLTSWGAAPAGFGTGVVYGVAVDMTAGAIYFRDAAGWMNSSTSGDAQPTSAAFTGIVGDYVPAVGHISSTSASSAMSINFGQRPFTHTVPTGYSRLNTYNIPDSAIPKATPYFSAFYYVGNGSGLQIGKTPRPISLYNLNASLRFKKASTPTLTRTMASAGSLTTWTRSLWVKRSELATEQNIFGSRIGVNDNELLRFNLTTNSLEWFVNTASVGSRKVTTQAYTSTIGWINIVQVWDTTNATAEDRMQVWVNGVRITSFTTNTPPAPNAASATNSTAAQVYGAYNGGNYLDGYLSEINHVDGLVLSASSFGQFDANGLWVPKEYTGSYGSRGYHLAFEDRTAPTAAAIGKDTSGNGFDFTPAGISLTAGVTYDGMNDVPTNTSLTVANFPTLNSVRPVGYTLSAGNLNLSATTTFSSFITANQVIPVTGKYYWEYACTNTGGASVRDIVGLVLNNTAQERMGTTVNTIGYSALGTINQSGSFSTWTNTDVIGIAVDCDSGRVWFGKQTGGTGSMVWQGSGDPSAGTNPNAYFFPSYDRPWVPAIGIDATASGSTVGSINFGQRPFSATVPTGFKLINGFNADETPSDLDKPDFVWIKNRNGADTHALFTSVSGVQKYISTAGSTAEVTDLNSLLQFNRNGFLLGTSTLVNNAGNSYMGLAWKSTGGVTSWNFDGSLGRTATMTAADPCVVSVSTNAFVAGQAVRFTTDGVLPSPITTGVTYYAGNILTNTTFNLYDTEANAIIGGATGRISTAGSSQSGTHTCRHASKTAANPTAGLSIIQYCGSGVDGVTVGHGLGATPSFFLIRSRSTASKNGTVYLSGLASPAHNNVIISNTTAIGVANTWLSNTAPNSSVITLGLPSDAAYNMNVSGQTYQIIAFAEIPGFSKFTTYLPTGTTDGPYVNCGFRPRWVMIKSTTVNTGGWMIFDGSRSLQNTAYHYLFAEGNSGENNLGVGVGLDFTATGFKIRTTTIQVNAGTTATYMVMAWAENPFKYALAR